MEFDLLLELAWKSALGAGLTLVLLRSLAARSAAEKSMVAHFGLSALLLLPVATLILPEVQFSTPAPLVASMTAILSQPGGLDPLAVPTPIAAESVDWGQTAVMAYLLPAVGLLGLLIVAVFRLHQVRNRAHVLVDSRWLTALAAAQHRLGFKHGTALLTSSELNSPISWGVVRPIIIVDSAAMEAVDKAEAIIAHELAHVERLDWLKLLVGRLATALFWFNPLVWMLARQCHQLCEEGADDAVLRSKVDKADYAQLLVSAVRHANGPALLVANGVAPSGSSIAQRIAHILDPARSRAPAGLGWFATSLAAGIGLNLALAAAEPVIAAPIGQQFSAGAGTRAAAALGGIDNPHAQQLAYAIRSGDWEDRRTSGSTLFHEPAAVAPLILALRDERPEVRRIAIWGLAEMRPTVGASATAPVAKLLQDAAPQVRSAAARALGDFGALAESENVARLLQDPDPSVRVQAAHALGDLQDPSTRQALEAALADPDGNVRTKARWALGQVIEAEQILSRARGN